MRARRNFVVPGLFVTCGLLLISVIPAGAKEKDVFPEPSGFLGDYSELTPHPKKDDLLVYRLRPGVLAAYDSFIVEPPLVYLDPAAVGEGIEPGELKMLADFLREEIVGALEEKGAYTVTDEAGEGTARIRTAIVDVVPVASGKNVAASLAGVAAGVGILVPRVDLGRAAIEVEILDSESDERLVAVIAAKEGKRFGGKIKGAKRWGDVKAAFKKWAKQLRKRLDEVHGE